jgi:hypothetical protein
MTDKNALKSDTEHSAWLSQAAPYEAPLTKAFDKLTSEIFIFLLAYVILIIGLAVFGEKLANTIKTLLYIIPVLGVAAYAWQNQKVIRTNASKRGVDVRAGMVTGSAKVVGSRGDPNPGNVKLSVGWAGGNSSVMGSDVGSQEIRKDNESADFSEKFLIEQFVKLNESNRRELIARLLKLLDKQGTER